MRYFCESPLAIALRQELPKRLKAHSYTIIDLAQEIAQDLGCPLCEVLTPVSEALMELVAQHQVEFDPSCRRVILCQQVALLGTVS
ncbi:hypothetical protein [Leptolyngbya iicbica]|nr:hypothetical protein [Leptolyngbya sp. LK]